MLHPRLQVSWVGGRTVLGIQGSEASVVAEAAQILQLLALLSEPFTFAEAAERIGCAPEELTPVLEPLLTAGLLVPTQGEAGQRPAPGFEHAEVWRPLLGALAGRPHLRLLEVGSFRGASALWLLRNVVTHPTSTLTCIDLFASDYELDFDRAMAAEGDARRLVKLKGISQEVLRRLPLEHYDVIYLDASRTESDELEDCVLAWRLLRPGGLLILDDFGGPPDWEPGVTRAIESFLRAYAQAYVELHRGFQLILRKQAALTTRD